MRRIPTALAVWSLFVWGVRIRNADGAIGPTLLSVTFVVLAVTVLVSRGRRAPILVLAAWTVAVWTARIVDIVVLSDDGAAFKAVHAALGAISIALAIGAARAVSSAPAPHPAPASGSGSRRRP